MLLRQRFIVKRLESFTGAFFAKKKKNLLEQMGEDPTAPQEKAGVPKKVIDAKTLEYLQKKLKAAKSEVIIDKEHYRIDVGLFLSRDPIFLQIDQGDMNHLRFRIKYAKKYKLLMPLPKELTEFQEKPQTFPSGLEDLPTHEIMYSDGTRLTYSGNSKLVANVDPTVNDPKSIQYASTYRTYLMVKPKGEDRWTFPTQKMPDKASFKDSKANFFNNLSERKWDVFFTNNTPICVTKRDLTEDQKKDPVNKKALGVKTFYFNAYHTSGIVSVNPTLYDDYAWVTRMELNKYLDKQSFEEVVHSVTLY